MTKKRSGNRRLLDGTAFLYGRNQQYVRDLGYASDYAGNPAFSLLAIRRVLARSTLARAVLRQEATNIVGDTGPMPTFANVENQDDRKRLKEFWQMWAMDVTTGGKIAWGQFCRAMVRTKKGDGRVFAIARYHSDHPFGIALMPTARDWVHEWGFGNAEMKYSHNGKEYLVINGVARSESGRIVGYIFTKDLTPFEAIRRRHTFGYVDLGGALTTKTAEKVWIDEARVLDYMSMDKTDDFEGSPSDMLPMIETLKQIEQLDSATLRTMRTAAKQMGFLQNKDAGGEYDVDDEDEIAPPTEFEENTIEFLPAGYEFAQFNPNSPNAQMYMYRAELLKNMCSAFGADYASISGDLKGVNYSSMRHGSINSRDHYRVGQDEFKCCICRPLAKILFPAAHLLGHLKISEESLMQAVNTNWRFRGWQWVDPLKDAVANQTMKRMGANSPQWLCAGLGVDFEAMVTDIAEAKQVLEEHGVSFEELAAVAGDPKIIAALLQAAGGMQGEPPEPDDDDEME